MTKHATLLLGCEETPGDHMLFAVVQLTPDVYRYVMNLGRSVLERPLEELGRPVRDSGLYLQDTADPPLAFFLSAPKQPALYQALSTSGNSVDSGYVEVFEPGRLFKQPRLAARGTHLEVDSEGVRWGCYPEHMRGAAGVTLALRTIRVPFTLLQSTFNFSRARSVGVGDQTPYGVSGLPTEGTEGTRRG